MKVKLLPCRAIFTFFEFKDVLALKYIIEKHNRDVYKKYNDKKMEIENKKKTITSIFSLEILKNKLNKDCLANIASFLSGKSGTIHKQISNFI